MNEKQLTLNKCLICKKPLGEYEEICRRCRSNAELKRKEIEEMT